MKAFYENPGEPDVGIAGAEMCLEFNLSMDDRDGDRKILLDFFDEFADGKGQVWFEDECPDCFMVLVKGKCISKNCVRNNG